MKKPQKWAIKMRERTPIFTIGIVLMVSLMVLPTASAIWQCPANCTCFAVGADSRDSYAQFNSTLQFLKEYRNELDFMIYVGDMDSVQINKETYHDIEMTNLPSYWVVGNHEIYPGPGETYIKNLYPSLNNTVNLFNDGRNSTYSIEYNNTHIIILDVYSEEVNGSVPYGGSQYNWLSADLEATDKSKQIFVVGHEPAYPEHRHVGNSLDQYPSDRDALWSLFDEKSVEGYFCGHTHYYTKNTSMLNVTQVDAGNMRWVGAGEGDGNSTAFFVAVEETGKNSTISVYSSDIEGNPFNLIDEFVINNSYYTEPDGGGGCGAYNITLPLGWSIIGWTNPTASTAHSTGTLIGGNCQYVTERNSTTGLYVTHVMSIPADDNFAIERGWGYFVRTTAETLWERDS